MLTFILLQMTWFVWKIDVTSSSAGCRRGVETKNKKKVVQNYAWTGRLKNISSNIEATATKCTVLSV